MKTKSLIVAAAVLSLLSAAYAETVHQTLSGDKAHTGDGGSAVDKKLLEVKTEAKADSGKIARVVGTMPQWGFVSYWFGVPTPAGKSTIRLKIYVDEAAPADFNIYTIGKSGQELVSKLKLPADAKPATFVTVDIPVDSKTEWSGMALKKAEKSDKPGPWIDTLSTVLP